MRSLIARARDGLHLAFSVLFVVVLAAGNLFVVAVLGYLAYELLTLALRLPRPVLMAALAMTGLLVLARPATRPPTLGQAILRELAGIRLGQSLRRR